jgi:xanthine phosphoribosyltransferase
MMFQINAVSTDTRFTKSFPVSWQELHRDAKALAWRLNEAGPWTGIIGIARGGLVPAVIVARELDLRLVDTICVAGYEHQTQGEARILRAPPGDGRGWVIVDDLVDTGATARIVRELLPQAHMATVYAKPAGRPLVDTFVTEVSQDTWIHFPWDTELQFVRPLAGAGRLR